MTTIAPVPDPLFGIETHTAFVQRPVNQEGWQRDLAAAFCGETRSDLNPRRIEKRNAASEVYFFDTDIGPLVVRGADAGLREQIEAQCRIVAQRAGDLMMAPLVTQTGQFTAAARDLVWLAYRSIPGHTYYGAKQAAPITVIRRGLELLDRLGAEPISEDARNLPSVEHTPDAWSDMLEALIARNNSAQDAAVRKYLRPDVMEILAERKNVLLTMAARARRRLSEDHTRTVVHDDMHHGNVLIDSDRITFIDLEDICIDYPGIAMGHCVFKLLRHCVHTGSMTAEIAREETLPRILNVLSKAPAWRWSRAELFEFAAARNFSDVHKIIDHFQITKSPVYMYDLNKRICNLFELSYFEAN